MRPLRSRSSTPAISKLGLAGLLAILATALPGRAADLEGRIGRIADSYVDSGVVPGLIVGISRPGSGVTIIRRGVSDLATGAPMDAANAQRIGSITKSFTVTRILQLADEGRFSLDDPIDKYVPRLRNGQATLRQLADMTSGIFNYTEDQAFTRRFARDLTGTFTDRQLVEVANRHAPYFPPGTGWHYSNTNTVLLGMVVERVTGRPLRAELTRHLIRPLGLDHTSYPTGIFLPAPFNHGYATFDPDAGRIDVTEVSPSGFSGAGAMVSNVDDLLLWGRALARGSLVRRSSQRERLRMVDASRGVGPYYDRYGLGLGRIDGWLGHTAEVPGYQSLVMHNLVADETVVILVNASGHLHVPTVMFQRITSLLPSAVPARPPALRLSGGRHRTTSRAVITIRGRAASAAGILLVEAANGRSGRRLARGRELWTSRVRLHPGRNVISIRAVDGLGRPSAVARIVALRN